MRASEWVQTIPSELGPARERAIRDALLSDARVDWPMVEVPIALGDSTVTIFASSDYLAVGTPDDFVRVPMNGRTAQELADALFFVLPTPRISDHVYRAAQVKLRPIPKPEVVNTAAQIGTRAFVEHSAQIEAARAGAPGLIAGIKKDVVIANRLFDHPDRVCIYGWHMPDGSTGPCGTPTLSGMCPIQGMSTIHEWTYADYSHGIRPISRVAFVDGQPTPITEVLKHPMLSAALSHEGPLRQTSVPSGACAARGPLSVIPASVCILQPDDSGHLAPSSSSLVMPIALVAAAAAASTAALYWARRRGYL